MTLYPKVSIIIPTKNEAANIENCLKSVAKQDVAKEIIVVDNNSSDQTIKIAKRYTSKVFSFGPERSSQRNFGLQKATAPFVLFLDADMEIEKNVLMECLQACKKNPNLVGIVIDEVSKGRSFLAKIKSLEKYLDRREKNIEAPRFFKKSALSGISGWDETLISGEDWDLSLRIQKLGRVGRIKKRIIHHEENSALEDIKKKYYYALHIGKYAQKHPKEFKVQAGFARFSSLFKDPKIIAKNPLEFLALLILKSAQYIAYLTARYGSQKNNTK